ncbi:MAG: sugar transferase [Acidobacteriota bacterium]
MIPPHRHLLHESFKLVDLLIMSVALIAAYWLSSATALSVFLSERARLDNVPLLMVLWIAWHLVFYRMGLYGSRRLVTRQREALDILWATTLGSLLISSAAAILKIEIKNPDFLLMFWTLSTLLTIIGRLSVRFALEWVRVRGRNLRHVLVVGTNPRALHFAQVMQRNPALGYHLLGFVDEEWEGADQVRGTGEIVADFDGLSRYLSEHVVDEVVVALPVSKSYTESSRILSICEVQGITVRFLWQFFEPKLSKAKIESFQNVPVLTLESGSTSNGQQLAKRLIDVFVSATLLIALAPLFLLTALAVKLASRGPVLFVQERVGFRKRTFRLFKFRTMVPDAERRLAELEHLNEVSGPVFKIKNDPRVTRIGAFLRRTSIDELPQLWNVFRGDMSLVGPRPLPIRDFRGFEEDRHRRRFSVPPGLTCLWQVSGRSSIQFEQWMQLDLQYIDHWSLWLDLKLLFWTIPVVLAGCRGSARGEFADVIEQPEEIFAISSSAKRPAA